MYFRYTHNIVLTTLNFVVLQVFVYIIRKLVHRKTYSILADTPKFKKPLEPKIFKQSLKSIWDPAVIDFETYNNKQGFDTRI